MSFLYENGWVLFIFSEGLTWLAALIFFVCRYLLRLERIGNLLMFFIILCTIFQAFLAGVNYSFTGKVSFFQVVIILFILYACTLGSSDFERLDQYLQKKFNKYRTVNNLNKSVSSHIKNRNRLFLFHTKAFLIIHLVWVGVDLKSSNYFMDHPFQFYQWLIQPHQGIFNHPTLNIMSYLWSIVYMIDLCFFVIFAFQYWIGKVKN